MNKDICNDIVESLDAGYVYVLDDKISYINKKAREIFGITVGEGDNVCDKIKNNDIIFAVGYDVPSEIYSMLCDDEYKECNNSAIIKKKGDSFVEPLSISCEEKLNLDVYYSGYRIQCEIDRDLKSIYFAIDGNEFSYSNTDYKIIIIDEIKNTLKEVKASNTIEEIIKGIKGEEKLYFKSQCLKSVIGMPLESSLFHTYTPRKFIDASQKQHKTDYEIIKEKPYIVTSKCLSNREVLLIIEDVENYNIVNEEKLKAANKYYMDISKPNEKDYTKTFSSIIGNSPEMLKIKYICSRVASSKSTILILGESGTGKTMLANEIHKISKFSDKPFIQVNCTSIPESLAESEFFGYEPGAFTGALNRGKEGYFKLAEGGTIFLDEIADISLMMQMKLLEVLQNRTYFKVGGSKKEKVDTRIIAATNKDLKQLVREGKFREDLYYRINVISITMPSLREIKTEIPFLARKLIKKLCSRLGCPEKAITDVAIKKLMEYYWGGNIRELENVLERAIHMCEGNVISQEHIIFDPIEENFLNNDGSLKSLVERYEEKVIFNTIKKCHGNKTKAMEELGMSKTQFYSKLKKYAIQN